VKSGLFVKLRNNFYAIKDSNFDYSFIANKLYQPSYVLLETALAHYNIIPVLSGKLSEYWECSKCY